MSKPSIDELLQNIYTKAGAIQLDADCYEHALNWDRVHKWARDIAIDVWDIREQLGFHTHEDLLIKLTMMLDEHPEEWDGPCMCKMCLEYAQ